jgi:hypothetical protein
MPYRTISRLDYNGNIEGYTNLFNKSTEDPEDNDWSSVCNATENRVKTRFTKIKKLSDDNDRFKKKMEELIISKSDGVENLKKKIERKIKDIDEAIQSPEGSYKLDITNMNNALTRTINSIRKISKKEKDKDYACKQIEMPGGTSDILEKESGGIIVALSTRKNEYKELLKSITVEQYSGKKEGYEVPVTINYNKRTSIGLGIGLLFIIILIIVFLVILKKF